MPEVTKNEDELLFVDDGLVETIKAESRKSSRLIARLLMHLNHEDPVQEMLIALCQGCSVVPNRSPGRSESLAVIEGEVLGTEGLQQLGNALYGDEDPSPPNASEPPISFSKNGDETLLRMRLPFVRAAEIDLSAFNDELVVQIGNFKRHVSLPRNLVGVKPGRARRDGDVLEIAFQA